MVEQTSIEAYHEILPELPHRQRQLIDLCLKNPMRDWTFREFGKCLGLDVCSISPRVNELYKMGIMVYSRNRICSVTYRRVKAWQLAPFLVLRR